MYSEDEVASQGYVQAHMWYNIAGANGFEDGVSNCDIFAKQMSPTQVEEAQKLAREWMEKHP